MPFSDNDIQMMQAVFKRLEPSMMMAIQFHDPTQELRIGCTFGFQKRKNYWYCLYQNFEKLSPHRMKILNKMSIRIPYKLHITYPGDEITRIGWKCSK